MKNHDEKENKLTRHNVLALDIATHTGYFSMHSRGTWDFSESMRRNSNKQHAAFRNTLIEYIKQNNIKAIIAEDVTAGNARGGFKSSVKLAEFRGILMEICDTLDLPEPTFINLKTVKKWATGNGNATKEMMIDFCKMRWQIEPCDDNEADAAHIFFYYIKKFNL